MTDSRPSGRPRSHIARWPVDQMAGDRASIDRASIDRASGDPAPVDDAGRAVAIGRALVAALALLGAALAGCTVGPDYQRPAVAMPVTWHTEDGWAPVDVDAAAAPKGDWWLAFRDPLLDALEPEVAVSNQTVREAAANYDKAVADLQIARSSLFPTLGLTASTNRQRSTTSLGGETISTTRSVDGAVSWSPDLWGEVRRSIESSRATAEASAATLANATLSARVALATAVIGLRITDAATVLARNAVTTWEQSLEVVRNQDAAGTIAPSTLLAARTQVDTARSNLIALGVARHQYANAIAVLAGRVPGAVDIPPSTTLPTLPDIPVVVPSTLLQRRPDIAAAERQVAAANAAIGVAEAAWYPSVGLSASGGVARAAMAGVLGASHLVWAIGATAAETLFDGGARSGQVAAARATHQGAVANYRATVLAAFEGVENDLASLQILRQQADVLAAAVEHATGSARIARNDYEVGTVDFTSLATALATEISSRQTALGVLQQRLVASVNLIGDLGGGWQAGAGPDAGPGSASGRDETAGQVGRTADGLDATHPAVPAQRHEGPAAVEQ